MYNRITSKQSQQTNIMYVFALLVIWFGKGLTPELVDKCSQCMMSEMKRNRQQTMLLYDSFAT